MQTLKVRDKVILWGLGIAALGYMYYRYILAQYSFTFKTVLVKNISDSQIDLDLMFDLSSNIGVGIEVSQIQADVTFNGIPLGTINKTDKIVVPNNSNVVITIPFSANLDKLRASGVSILSSVLLTNNRSVSVSGFSSCKISALPFKVNVDINETINF